MFTFGYQWRHWEGDVALADGPAILDYLRTVARECGVDRLVRYQHRVVGASWDSVENRWTVGVDHAGEPVTITTDLLWACGATTTTTGAFSPELPGQEDFAGPIVHPSTGRGPRLHGQEGRGHPGLARPP